MDPVEGPLGVGVERLAKILSLAEGSDILLPAGLIRLPPTYPVAGGSMSSDDRKEVLSKSVLVLVIVKKESRRLFCTAFGVPFRSKIYIKGTSTQTRCVDKCPLTNLLEI